ncbi:MAG: FCD domain-containing protein [Candidatus Rokubacteria bacterium]|nr:FCD domain-containing protein [Candidatus Rokubacteria bacterium]
MDINMGTVTTTLDHHRAIHRALERRDGGAAEAAMREHILHIQRRLEQRERRMRRGR